MRADALNTDFRDLLNAFLDHRVEFVVVGAWAAGVHGHPRATGDLDVFVRPEAENARRVVAALMAFGAPLATHGVGEADFVRLGTVYQIGLPPRRIDVMTAISGVSFEEAWSSHIDVRLSGRGVPFLGRAILIKNKRAAGRPKDLADVQRLENDQTSR
jgi:hypothetical protein